MNNWNVWTVAAACVLAFGLVLDGSAQATWNGGGTDDNWSTPANWNGTTLAGGEALVFGGLQRLTNVNDTAADTAYAGITFNSTAGAFSLSGNRITLGGSVVNNDAETQVVGFDMILNDTRTVGTVSGNLFLNGALSGSGGLTKAGGSNSRTLVLGGDNTYDGETTVSTGILRAAHSRALGSTAGGTTVASGNWLELAGGITVTGETVTIFGKGNNNGALQVQAGTNTWAGRIVIGSSDARIGVNPANGELIVSGSIEDGANTFPLVVRCADPGGPIILSGTNTYKGETQLVVGTLRLDGGNDRLPTNTVVRLGNGSNVAYATLDLNGFNQTVKGITADGSTMVRKIGNSATNYVTLTVNATSAYTFNGALDGRLNLDKRGPARLTLSSSNTHTGMTSVIEGELLLDRPLVIGDSTFNTGDGPMGTLAFGTNTVVNFGGLVGTNDLVLTNASGAAVSLRVRGNQVCAFDGMITNGCDFTKAGFGTLALNNVNVYTGRTYLAGGTLKIASEAALGAYPSAFVQDQIVFDGGTLRFETNYTLAVNNRGITLAAGGGTLMTASLTNLLTVNRPLVGPGPFATHGLGVVLVTASNAYDGVTTVNAGALRITDRHGLGSTAGGTVVLTGSQLELGDGVAVSNETVTVNGAGITPEPPPPTVPSTNRGALQSAANATAEWAGPVMLGSNQARFGAQNGGHLIISGVIDDGAASYAIRTSSNFGDRTRGVELRAHNTYGGSTDLTRGTLLLGISDALPTATVLDVHWADSNNGEYTGLDLNGFDQTVGALKNSGNTGLNAMITNRSASVSTLTVNQAVDTTYGGTIYGPVALVKDGAGRLTLAYPTRYSGTTTVRGGALALGTHSVISSASALVVDGGTLETGATTNTFASLTVSSAGTIDLGSGQILFSAQTADAWSSQLALTGTLGPTSFRTQPLLTADQLGRIRYNGARVTQDASGYLSPFYGMLIRVY